MRTYPHPAGGWAGGLRLLAGLALLVVSARPEPLAGQQARKYLVELSVAGVYNSFDGDAQLDGAPGGVGRLGVWLPLNFSLEVEGGFTKPKNQGLNDAGVSVKNFGVSALYNFLIGSRSSFYLKAGGGSTKYGSGCPAISAPTDPICGRSGALLAGVGFRVGVSPTVMIRAEGLFNRNKSHPPANVPSKSLSNFGISGGVSLMLGSKPILDADADGILDNRDRCTDTPSGASVDDRGCPSDGDSDGVPDGVDRCPTTVAGAAVDVRGCSKDSDGDNIPDGLDRCPDTAAGVLVDPRGCPKDSDGDQIPDGLDRCSETPRGATVDALGCPGDEDGDGVLDGLDRCARTPTGAAVTPNGCPQGQAPTRQAPAPAPPPAGEPAPTPAPSAAQPGAARPNAPQQPRTQPDTLARPMRRPNATVPGTAIVSGIIPGVAFAPGTARLMPSSYQALDSIADILRAKPDTRIEIGAHTDNSGTSADNLRITSLQAEAVRDYLVVKGVNYQQVAARGYGSSVPLTPDTTPSGRAANRRVEIRPAPTGP